MQILWRSRVRGAFLQLPKRTGRIESAWVQLVRSQASRGHSKRRHLPAAAGDIGESRRAEAREEAAKFSPEQVRRKVHQHVAVVHTTCPRDVGENLTANRNSFLNNPRAVLCSERALDGFVPARFAGFPSKGDAVHAVLIA